ncbi:hypothetical protein N7519_004636 [Penicillium mononematosum]|uniref:uncharacterized protein n=1 Tax=Penicillium mononematosum TaxID=268346 RepID=UPI00254886F2|nr:uncharacterized protein N7519_004636 [Penicillium mononematosum]KAJ6189728.1 hypothetical protein N7519_004636 [Penicillium mononematosum]
MVVDQRFLNRRPVSPRNEVMAITPKVIVLRGEDAVAETAGAVPIAIYHNGSSQPVIALWNVTVVRKLVDLSSVPSKGRNLRNCSILFTLTEDLTGDTGQLLVTIVEDDDGMPLSQKCDIQPKQSSLTGLTITQVMVTHTVSPSSRRYLESLGNRWLQMENDKGNPSNLQPGPYLYIE